jgi:dienelactone hydrolase
MAAVLMLHGSGGVSGVGAFYAKALQDAGIATLEIMMFQAGGRPRRFMETMPYAAAALKWLAVQPDVDGWRLGVIGFSWGGGISMLMSSELVQERLGNDVPKPAVFVSFYPVCSNWAFYLANTEFELYNAHTRINGAPMLIYAGTRDDYEEGERPCDAFVATWPAIA